LSVNQLAQTSLITQQVSTSRTVNLTLSDVVTLLLQNNLDLKNSTLDRIVQRQQLREAESVFNPKIEPRLEIRTTQSLSSSNTGLTTSRVQQRVQVVGQMRTPLGTTLTVTASPFESSQRLGISFTQPLLRGAGTRVNTSSVKQARLGESLNQLAFRQTLINQITQATTIYRNLAKSQEQLRIQQLSFENQRKQAEFTQVLINAGRRPRSAMIDIEANIASTRTQLINAQNALKQAQADLLQLLSLKETLNIVVPQNVIDEFNAESPRSNSILAQSPETLLNLAYAQRPDYLQAQLDIQTAELRKQIAVDNRRWSLNLEGSLNAGNASEATGAIVLNRVLNDPAVETEFQQRRVDVLKQQNTFTKLRETVKIEVESRLRDVSTARDRITSARQARELAEQRLAIATEKFKRGRDTDIFETLVLQNNVVTAQNEEVNAKIELLDAVSRLEQTLGITLDSWKTAIQESKLLQLPQ
jgi:outer membrane protein